MSDREPGSTQDDGPVAPPIPSFDSLRGPRRRSALDLLLPPAEAAEPADEEPAPAEPAQAASARPAAGEPRPAEWGDLLAAGTRLAVCAARLLTTQATRGLAGLRFLLRG